MCSYMKAVPDLKVTKVKGEIHYYHRLKKNDRGYKNGVQYKKQKCHTCEEKIRMNQLFVHNS